jgi:hypothetical protein
MMRGVQCQGSNPVRFQGRLEINADDRARCEKSEKGKAVLARLEKAFAQFDEQVKALPDSVTLSYRPYGTNEFGHEIFITFPSGQIQKIREAEAKSEAEFRKPPFKFLEPLGNAMEKIRAYAGETAAAPSIDNTFTRVVSRKLTNLFTLSTQSDAAFLQAAITDAEKLSKDWQAL